MPTEALFDAIANAIVQKVGVQLHAVLGKAIAAATKVQPTLLNVKDAAIYLGRSEQAVQHLIFRRELPVVRVGRRVHLDRRDPDAFIERHKY
jgi:excisionase family DNA binding protein